MDVNTIASAYVQASQQKTQESVEMAMLKKGMEVQQQQGQQAISLIQSVTPSSSLPDNLGQNLNVVA